MDNMIYTYVQTLHLAINLQFQYLHMLLGIQTLHFYKNPVDKFDSSSAVRFHHLQNMHQET